ncbi:MAG TPA: UDP-glucose/GDP-mannose dehydrogenase family protein [Actinomycetota bacterium]
MKVAIIGTGHVGLVTAVTLAAIGHDVSGMDADEEKIEALRQGRAPFFEPGLQAMLEEQAAAGRLRFSPDPRETLPGAEIVFICVGTPSTPDGEANLAAVERSCIEIARHADAGVVVVGKSTVPAGTADRMRETFRRERPDGRFHLVSNPEFLREGSAIHDTLEPDRVLVGAEDEAGFDALRRLYAPLLDRGVPLIETDVSTAELAKHASNAFLALKISYVNALARLCERVGADVTAVTNVMGSDPRIGGAFLRAGIGYGGHCFPKDVAAFGRLADRLGYPFPILAEIARINDEAVEAVVELVRDAVWNVPGKRIAILGLSFKPETDDIRLSPALALAARLLELGAEVAGYDPRAAANAKAEVPDLVIAPDPYAAAEGAHAIVLATEWSELVELDPGRLRAAVAQPVLIDARNALDGAAFAEAGFEYRPIGRPALRPD